MKAIQPRYPQATSHVPPPPQRLPTAPPRAALPAPPVPRRASLPRALKPTTPRLVAGTRASKSLESPPLLTRRRPHRPMLPGNPAPFLPQADPGPSLPPHQTPPLPPTLTLPTPTRTLNLPSPFFLLRPFFLHDLSSFLRFPRHELTRPGMDSPEPRHLRMTRITPAQAESPAPSTGPLADAADTASTDRSPGTAGRRRRHRCRERGPPTRSSRRPPLRCAGEEYSPIPPRRPYRAIRTGHSHGGTYKR